MSESSTSDTAAAVSDEHARLQPFAGTFRAEIKMWFGSGEPMSVGGTMVNAWDLGGRFLKQVFTCEPPGFQGRGYWGFNAATGQYEGFWIDTAGTMMHHETGSVDDTGKVWTMRGELTHPQTGKRMGKRSVITLEGPDSHRVEIFYSAADGVESRSMELRYRRLNPHIA